MNVYCDTSSLFSNALRLTNPKAQAEASAIRMLLNYHQSGEIKLFRSNVTLRELEKTTNQVQRTALLIDFLQLVPVVKDENVLGFSSLQTDRYGGHISNPLVSDVQDDKLVEELVLKGLSKQDAQHFAQALSNQADVFLTRDEKHFINRRKTLSTQYNIKILLPSELLVSAS
jgi:hypothetical protein